MDILGLPLELVELFLQRIDCAAAMRLGLSHPTLLKWLNSNDKYWGFEYSFQEMDVKSFGPLLPAKKRVAMRFSAIQNLTRPDFDNWHVIQRSGSFAVQSTMPQRGTLCLSNFSDYLLGDPESYSYSKLIDLANWPHVTSTSLGGFATQTERRLLVGNNMLVSDLDVEFGSHLETLGVISLGGDVARSRRELQVDLTREIVILPTDAKYERMCFLHTAGGSDTSDDPLLFRAYDIPRDKTGVELALPDLEGLQSFFLTGDYFCARTDDKFVIVKIDPVTLEPSIIHDGPLAFDWHDVWGSLCLTPTRLLVLLNPNLDKQLSVDDPDQEMKLVAVPYDQLGDGEARQRCLASHAVSLPAMDKARFVSLDSLAVVFCRDTAIFIDLTRSQIIRYMQCGEEISDVVFVDSTLLVVFFENSIIVVDLLERRAKAEPAQANQTPFIQFGFTLDDF